MLPLLIKRWRTENDVSQPHAAALLTKLGWKLSAGRLSTLETAAARGENECDWRDHQIEAVRAATGYPREMCLFWGGRHPFNLVQFDPDDVRQSDLETGFAMLAMCLGKPDAGPRLTPEMHERASRQFGLDRPLSNAEIVMQHQERRLSTELPLDLYGKRDAATS